MAVVSKVLNGNYITSITSNSIDMCVYACL